MKTAQIRQKFLDYFEAHGHTIKPSASLIPDNDKTLLFVNSGMVPFKDVFSGGLNLEYKNFVSCQRCMRAGGKHNDLENVGYTARHHTFFEMLGNFSFGDYFKLGAISYAWQFLVTELKIPKEKLWVSIFEEDDEAEDIWVNTIGFPKERISRCGIKDNFWQMGDTGPCGPCSEIFYDHGAKFAGDPPGYSNEDGDRYIEIWNLVFTQFDKQQNGYLKPLATPCVDTGMGLERLAAVLQNKNNNYDTDDFKDIIKTIVKMTPTNNKAKPDCASVRVIADHIRAATFMIVDGVMPTNEGRGYVLRRIIRRAIHHGHKINISKVFFYKLAIVLATQNKTTYPELHKNLINIEKTLQHEEERFIKTLDQGTTILKQIIANLKGDEIDGETAFKLYDTYGFPVDLTTYIAKESNIKVDISGFEKAMNNQKARAKKASIFYTGHNNIIINNATEFLGYQELNSDSIVKALIVNNQQVTSINNGSSAIVVLNKSSFYGESGGQIGDSGALINKNINFVVNDTQKQISGALEHHGILKTGSCLKVGAKLKAKVDNNKRKHIAGNHSATHLLHAALHLVLGKEVTQKGSLITADKLRFDFSLSTAITKNNLDKIESIVNHKILSNAKVYTDITNIETAKKNGAIALFGEKYDSKVRVLTMGDDNFSIELCGGTHVKRLGDIGLFRIVSESSIATGIRRIEAITGYAAYTFNKQTADNLNEIANMVKTSNNKAIYKVSQLIDSKKNLEKQITLLKKQIINNHINRLLKEAKEINGVKLLTSEIQEVNSKDLRDLMDLLKNKLGSAIIVLATVTNNKITLIAGVTKNLINSYHAGKILNQVAAKVGGKGGGRPDLAQGGGTELAKLSQALAEVKDIL